MTSVKDFFVCVFETGMVFRLIDSKMENPFLFDESTLEKLEDLKKEIEEIDYDAINDVLAKLGALQYEKGNISKKRKSLNTQYKILSKRYIEIGEIDIETDKGYHIFIMTTPVDRETIRIVDPSHMYTFLRNMTVKRGKKEWVVDKEMILDIYRDRKELYRMTLENQKTEKINNLMSDMVDVLQEYINNKHPIKFKHRSIISKKDIECNESKNGILRGVVHQIGYSVTKDSSDIFCRLFNSGYLEVQHKKFDKNSGIFTRLLGYGIDRIDDIYYVEQNSIYLIMSLSVLEDFDYWFTDQDVFGDRTDMSFYKGFCNGCEGKLKPLEDYSAAERGYMSLNNVNKRYQELVLSSDINLNRYVQAVYIPNKSIFDGLMAREDLPLWVKALLTTEDDVDKVYRKNCTGEEPEKITKAKFNKISKLIEKREKITVIPPLNIKSINKKKKIQLIYRDDIYFERFPPDS